MADDDPGRTSIRLFGIVLLARVVGFLGLVYFTRVIPPERLDIYFLFYLVIQVASLVSNVGLSQALVRRISEQRRANETFSAGLVTVAGASAIVAVMFYGFREPIGAYIGLEAPTLLTISVALWLISDVHLSSLQGEDRVLAAGLLQLFQDIVRVAVGAALITVGFGPVGLIYGVIAGFVGTVLVGYPVIGLSVTLPTVEDFRRLFDISRYTMIFGPTNFVYFWLDTFMIGLLLPVGNVSPYEVAWQTTRVLILANTAINRTIFPKVSRWASQDEVSEISRILPGAILFSLIFPIPGIVGIAVLGEDILGLVYRPTYAHAALPMVFLAAYMAVESLQRITNTLYIGMNRADVPFRSRLVGVTAALLLNVTLIPRYGLLGAAVATFTAKFVDASIQWLRLPRLVSIPIPSKSLAWMIGAALAMGGVIVALRQLLAPATVPALFALVAIGVGVYSTFVMLNTEIRQVVLQYVPLVGSVRT